MSRPRRVLTGLAVLLGAGLVVWAIVRAVPVLAVAGDDPATRAQEDPVPTAQDTAEAAQGAPPAAQTRVPATAQTRVPEVRPTEAEPTGQTAEEAIVDHNTATRGPRQPIPFSHRFHVRELQIDCMYCHLGTERSETGVVPSLEVCMGCHRTAGTGLEPIEELRGYWDRGEQIPWVWVSKLPDFVQFPHRAHIRTGIQCQECHGPVEDMNRVYRAEPFTMGWCLDCHRSEPRDTDVATDHLLVRENPPPSIPEGRQLHSFYPVQIDTKYGHYRGPIDCFVCHF